MKVENWSFLDACYFSIITITKIGFGDLVPSMLPPEKYARYYLLI